ncbi:MAG: TrkA C-terminal domain-containing protein [Thermoanaerobaculia bacterium]
MLRSAPVGAASEAVLAALEAGTTVTCRVDEQGLTGGRTLRETDLWSKTGTSVVVVERGEQSFPNQSPDLTLEPGDKFVLVGSHEEIDHAFRFLAGEEVG